MGESASSLVQVRTENAAATRNQLDEVPQEGTREVTDTSSPTLGVRLEREAAKQGRRGRAELPLPQAGGRSLQSGPGGRGTCGGHRPGQGLGLPEWCKRSGIRRRHQRAAELVTEIAELYTSKWFKSEASIIPTSWCRNKRMGAWKGADSWAPPKPGWGPGSSVPLGPRHRGQGCRCAINLLGRRCAPGLAQVVRPFGALTREERQQA